MRKITDSFKVTHSNFFRGSNAGDLALPACDITVDYTGTRLSLNILSSEAGTSLTIEGIGGKTESAIATLKVVAALLGSINLNAMAAAAAADGSGEINKLSQEIRSMASALDNTIVVSE